MRWIATLLVSLPGAMVLTGAPEAKSLQGSWEVTELVAYGKKVDPKLFKGTKFVFKDDKLTVVPGDPKGDTFVSRSFTIKVDAKQKPTAIDLTLLEGASKGMVSPGIFEITGDTLRWCQPDGEKTKERPKDFTSPTNSDRYLITLKRAK